MPAYTVHIAYSETIQRNAAVRVIAPNGGEAEALVRHEFRRHMDGRTATMMVQDTDYGRAKDWPRQPTQETFATVAALEEED